MACGALLPAPRPLRLGRALLSRLPPPRVRPRISAARQYRNLRLSSIGYASPPRLRPRLPRGRSALPRNPWIFGLGDSHPHLATHSGILSSQPSTAPRRCGFDAPAMLPYQRALARSRASAACFSPGHFRRGTSRPVSYYALFQCLAASGPTSWLSLKSHILSHLTRTSGPWL